MLRQHLEHAPTCCVKTFSSAQPRPPQGQASLCFWDLSFRDTLISEKPGFRNTKDPATRSVFVKTAQKPIDCCPRCAHCHAQLATAVSKNAIRKPRRATEFLHISFICPLACGEVGTPIAKPQLRSFRALKPSGPTVV